MIPTAASGVPPAARVTVPAIQPAVKANVKLIHLVAAAVTVTPVRVDTLCNGALALTLYVPGGTSTVYEPSPIVSLP